MRNIELAAKHRLSVMFLFQEYRVTHAEGAVFLSAVRWGARQKTQSLISAKCRTVMPVDDIRKSCRYWTVSVLMFNCTAVTILVMNIFLSFWKNIISRLIYAFIMMENEPWYQLSSHKLRHYLAALREFEQSVEGTFSIIFFSSYLHIIYAICI